MSWGKELISEKVIKESQKQTLVDQFGPSMFWIWEVIGKVLLGVLGALADAVVFFSILYLAFRHLVGCAVAAIVVCVIIHAVFGYSGYKALFNYFSGNYRKNGFGPMIMLNLALVGIVFASTIYFSLNTDKVAVAVAEEAFQVEDVNQKDGYYEDEITKERIAYNEQRAELMAEYNRLVNDKIMSGGRLVTRWSSDKAAKKIINQTLPALRADYENNVDQLRAEKQRAQDQIAGKNQDTNTEKAQKVAVAKTAVVGYNLGINFLRLLILAMYSYFMARAVAETTQEQRQPTPQAEQPQQPRQLADNNQGQRERQPTAPQKPKIAAKAPSRKVFFNRSSDTGQVGVSDISDGEKKQLAGEAEKMLSDYRDKIVVINGEPTLPYVGSDDVVKDYTYRDAQKMKNAYKSKINKKRNAGEEPTQSQLINYEFFAKMENELKELRKNV